MEYIDMYREKLQENIGENRFEHCIRVMNIASDLAKKYNIDIKKTEIASLLHDCGKYLHESYIIKKSKELNLKIDECIKDNVQLIHAPLGAIIAKLEYGIHDEEILNAIKYHTTGREDMSTLEKIIYIADYIEPNRKFHGVDEIRNLAFENIDYAILISMNRTIKHLIDKNWIVHTNTIKARNYLLNNVKNHIM